MEKLSKAEQILYNICLKQTEELFMKEVENIHEELKYYTPDIEDIKVGYECEIHTMTTGGLIILDMLDKEESKTIQQPNIEYWVPIKCDLDIWDNKTPHQIVKLLNNNQVRTPYLTKEQIEAEGWIFKIKSVDLWFESDAEKASNLQDFYGYKCYKLFLNYGLHDNKIKIKGDFTGGCNFNKADTLFEGFCPSVNELRIICKLLNIK